MRYEVFGFNQSKVVEQFSEKVDTNDLLILDYIIDAIASPKMLHTVVDGVAYVWLNHEKVLEDLPILNIKVDTLKRRLKSLEDLGLLQTTKVFDGGTRGGSRAFYCITETCYSLRYDGVSDTEKSTPLKISEVEKNPRLTGFRSGKKSTSYNLLTKKDKLLENIVENPAEISVESVVSIYNETCTNLPKVRALTHKRKKDIQNLLKNHTIEELKEAFQKANESEFLTGNNDRGWKADIDFFLREDKLISILEGKYSGTSGVNNTVERGVQSSNHRANITKILEDIRSGNAIEY